MGTKLANIPLSLIKANPVALRDVDKEDDEYIRLRDSIAGEGILNPINVFEKVDETDGSTYYVINDGLHRFTAAGDVGLQDVPCAILDKDSSKSLELQLIGNLNRIQTTPVAQTRQLQRIMSANPTMTVPEVAQLVYQSVKWVNDRLGLLKLTPEIQKIVDSGEMSLPNAYALSKLPKEEQVNFLDQAMTQTTAEFVPMAEKRKKELDAAARQGRAANPVTFEPNPHLRKLSEFKAEAEKPVAGPSICAAENITTSAGGFAAGVQWALSLDKASVAAAQAKFEQRQREATEAKARRAEEAARKKIEKAQAEQEKAAAALAALG